MKNTNKPYKNHKIGHVLNQNARSKQESPRGALTKDGEKAEVVKSKDNLKKS